MPRRLFIKLVILGFPCLPKWRIYGCVSHTFAFRSSGQIIRSSTPCWLKWRIDGCDSRTFAFRSIGIVIRYSTWHAPTLNYPEYSDFSHGQNGRSSSRANVDYAIVHASRIAYHQSRRYERSDFNNRFIRQAKCAERLN